MNLLFADVAYAADLDSTISKINSGIVNPALALLVALGLAFFVYGMLEFLINASDENKRTTGKWHMLWSVVGLAIMLGVWGILQIALDTVGIGKDEVDLDTGEINLKDYTPPN